MRKLKKVDIMSMGETTCLLYDCEKKEQIMRFDEIFSQQSRKKKQNITYETMQKMRVVEIEGFDREELKKINLLQKEVLCESKKNNNSNEVGILLYLLDWTYVVVYGNETGISLRKNDKAKQLLLTAPRHSLVFLHNHPKNSCFSERDIETFLTADAIMMMSVVCNNGRQYFLKKDSDFDKNFALLFYEKIFENTENGSVKEFLRICGKVNLKFTYGGEPK